MAKKTKKDKIKSLVIGMLKQSNKAMIDKIDKVLNSGAIDVEEWNEEYDPMILPKFIVIALLQDESTQYDGKGTSFEKNIKKEVKNIKCFI